MICSSVNLLFFMPIILHFDGLHKLYAGTAGAGKIKSNKRSIIQHLEIYFSMTFKHIEPVFVRTRDAARSQKVILQGKLVPSEPSRDRAKVNISKNAARA